MYGIYLRYITYVKLYGTMFIAYHHLNITMTRDV